MNLQLTPGPAAIHRRGLHRDLPAQTLHDKAQICIGLTEVHVSLTSGRLLRLDLAMHHAY